MKIVSTRNTAFDLLKCFAIYLVIYCHILQYLQPGDYLDKIPYVYVYSFHMPLFMSLTGYFSLSSMDLGLVSFLKKKGSSLLLPALSWGGVELCFIVLIWIITGKEIDYILTGFVLVNVYWYLKSAFICYCLYWLCHRRINNQFVYVLLLLLTFLICVFVQVHNKFIDYNLTVMYLSFLAGVFIRRHIDFQKINWIPIFVLFLLFLILLSGWDRSFWHIPYLPDATNIDIFYDYGYKIGYRVAVGLSGALFFVFLFYIVFRRYSIGQDFISKWLLSVGRDTLGLYCAHLLFLEVFLFRFKIGKWVNELLFDLIIAPLIALVMIICLQFLLHMIEKNKVLRLYFLGKI